MDHVALELDHRRMDVRPVFHGQLRPFGFLAKSIRQKSVVSTSRRIAAARLALMLY
jgi:hypothetical protein